MPTGSVVKQAHDCTITISDGAALTYSPSLFDGNVSIGNFQRKQREVATYEVRGQLKAVRHTNRVYPTFTLTIQLANFSGSVDVDGASETESPADVFNRAGTWASATSTLPVNMGGGDVFCVDIDINVEGTDLGESNDHNIKANSVHGVVSPSLAEPGVYTIECTVYEGFTGDISILEG